MIDVAGLSIFSLDWTDEFSLGFLQFPRYAIAFALPIFCLMLEGPFS